ncbi:hypothetical protein DYB32_003899 [Aphanomyces invadans]|uniref:EamA domain-containing protein n=1 Tax=Aphanomyces invadans TaxID=157072 RepID=A0A3R6VN67_9STRA|nr:hypothetical protein DYB32_003899 [Aphanomyces invadans]
MALVSSIATSILCGQAIAVTVLLQYIGTKYLNTNGNAVATFQTAIAFVLLALTCLPFVLGRTQIRRPWWLWLVLGLAHVEGHFCVIKAFASNANYAFMGLLMHFTIPFHMLLAYSILRTRYSLANYLGALAILAGTIVAMIGRTDDGSIAAHVWTIGAAAFAATALVLHKFTANMTSELVPPVEIFAKIGVVGTVLSAIQMAILGEFSTMTTTAVWSGATSTYFIGYTLAVLLFYAVTSSSHHATESTSFHASLTLVNLYTALSIAYLFDAAITPVLVGTSGAMALGACLYGWREPFEGGFRRKLSDRTGGPEPTMDALMDSIVVPVVMALPYSPESSDGAASTSIYYLDSSRHSNSSIHQPDDEPVVDRPTDEIVYTKDYFEGREVFTMEDGSPASTPRRSVLPHIVSFTSNHGTI